MYEQMLLLLFKLIAWLIKSSGKNPQVYNYKSTHVFGMNIISRHPRLLRSALPMSSYLISLSSVTLSM